MEKKQQVGGKKKMDDLNRKKAKYTLDVPIDDEKLPSQAKFVNNSSELLQHIPTEVLNENLDSVLEAVKTLDATCDYSKCKSKTNLMGQNCEFCKKKYCFKHGLPEVHGCGEAVKKHTRQTFLQPKTMKTVRQEEDLKNAKQRLEVKLKNMQISRMSKTGNSSNQKKKK